MRLPGEFAPASVEQPQSSWGDLISSATRLTAAGKAAPAGAAASMKCGAFGRAAGGGGASVEFGPTAEPNGKLAGQFPDFVTDTFGWPWPE